MTEGKLAKWLKKEGDEVKSGDVLAEIETDKATMEVEAVDEGRLARIVVPDGTDGVAVNAVIAILTADGEAAPDAPAQAKAPAPEAGGPPQEAPTPVPNTTKFKDAPFTETKNAPPPGAPAPKANGEDHGERVFASPLARRMAKQAGIDLAGLKGSGPNGRIVRADIDAAGKPTQAAPQPEAPKAEAAPSAAAAPPAPKPAAAPAITAPHKKLPNSSMRKIIARRLAESKQTVPHFYLTANIDIDALLKLRAELNGKSAKEGTGRVQAFRQRPYHQGLRHRFAAAPHGQRQLHGRRDHPVRRRRHLDRGGDPRRVDHADHLQGRPARPRRDQQFDEGS